MTDVFVSYQSGDRDAAKGLAGVLAESGRDVWWDRESLLGGDGFRDRIQAALDAAKVVVVLWSRTAVKSDWVRAEAGTAREARKLVPVALDDVRPPLPFNEIHTIALHGYRGGRTDAGVAQLLAAVDARLEPSRARRLKRRFDRLSRPGVRRAEMKAAAAPVTAAVLLAVIHLWLLHHVPSWATLVVGVEVAAALLAVLVRVRLGADEALHHVVALVVHRRTLIVLTVVVAVLSCLTTVRVPRPDANATLAVRVGGPGGAPVLRSGALDQDAFHRLLPAPPWGRDLTIRVDGHRTLERRAAAWRGAHVAPGELRPLCRALLRLPVDFLKHRREGVRVRVERVDGAPIGEGVPFEDRDEAAILVGEDERDLVRLAARIDGDVEERWRDELLAFEESTKDRLVAQWRDPILLVPEEDLALDAVVVVALLLPGTELRSMPVSLGGVPFPDRLLTKGEDGE